MTTGMVTVTSLVSANGVSLIAGDVDGIFVEVFSATIGIRGVCGWRIEDERRSISHFNIRKGVDEVLAASIVEVVVQRLTAVLQPRRIIDARRSASIDSCRRPLGGVGVRTIAC